MSDVVVDTEFGASLPGVWVPAPRYLMRRHRVLQNTKTLAPGSLVEVGCGAGALLHDFVRMGFACRGVEASTDALAVARRMHSGTGTDITQAPDPTWHECFDYLLSCEVLEHINDDAAALKQWVGWLKPGGTAVLSVPAHQWLWGKSDEWAGHFRRYARAQFEELVSRSGLLVDRVECYGFPVLVVTRSVRNWIARRSVLASREQNTARSGVDRSLEVKMYGLQRSLPLRAALRATQYTQDRFLQTDLGEGYLIVARKPR